MQNVAIEIAEIIERLKIVLETDKDADVAKALGVKPQKLSVWKVRNTIPFETLTSFCIQNAVSMEWLLAGKGRKTPLETGEKSACLSTALETVVDEGDGLFAFVRVAEPALSAGTGTVVESEEMREQYAFRRDWLRRAASSIGNCILFFVNGDSMAPALEHNDLVLVDMGRTKPRPGRIFAIASTDGAADGIVQVKRIEVIGNTVKIISDNPDYRAYDIDGELSNFRVIGQVIWLGRELERPRY